MTAKTQPAKLDTVTELRRSLARQYSAVRGHTDAICRTLEPEDCVIQSMPDVSPTRWHLAHTTWFFETFVLKQFADYSPVCHEFEFLFNSYYNTVGDQFPRDRRGLLSRPTVAQVRDYRDTVDDRMITTLEREDGWTRELLDVLLLGLHHEQQHQELMLTDIKHVFSCNPLLPAHVEGEIPSSGPPHHQWIPFPEGLQGVGHQGDGFCFDNELPRHRVFVEPFELSNRLVTNGEYLQFIEDDGYRHPEHWLSLGWNHVEQQQWSAPLYWIRRQDQWFEFTLGGLKELDLSLPVTHISYFEADAYAHWSGARLATEAEWEVASASQSIGESSAAECFESGTPVHPTQNASGSGCCAMFGSSWQWTSSSYAPYPGYRAAGGALGEYNGKFMCNQYVLRGSSCATSPGHARKSYRNFFPPDARWQFTGIRLARS